MAAQVMPVNSIQIPMSLSEAVLIYKYHIQTWVYNTMLIHSSHEPLQNPILQAEQTISHPRDVVCCSRIFALLTIC